MNKYYLVNNNLDNYLIDVLGYSEEDLRGKEVFQKFNLINNISEFNKYSALPADTKEIRGVKNRLKTMLVLNKRFFNGFERTTIRNFIDLINVSDYKVSKDKQIK